ncbi:hypothetical protein PsYK624_035790 [Phanerochaete sordida]|uniref:XRRM domain-containing protein n=1 Tax=Phanerochaete sordida TaxID=48140 RepID=A0A9P3G3E3_9APHY|nr:hypothetical protein PsYK624_035790 [Phanerochaete sordida]
MLRLTMTDYALWADAELRRTLEFAEEGYIPLVALIDRLPLSDDIPLPPEGTLVKAIRAHASDIFDVRMLMSAPSRQAWYGKNPTSRDALGGYEVRLKDAKDALYRARNSMRNEWDARTIYIENVPPQHRNVAGIYRFITSLLPESTTDDLIGRVQHISLPRHHLDKPDGQPKCKGFALVTLANAEDVASLLQHWPWQRAKPSPSATAGKDLSDAARYGLRMTTKSHWGKLNDEFLAYRQRLLDQIAEEDAADEADEPTTSDPPPPAAPEEASAPDAPPAATLDLSAPFPPDCLVFVRHVHPETNKTTLRTLLARAFADASAGAPDAGIDYVDFSKGMDTCHVRLAAPRFTAQLVRFFAESPTAQAAGLDAAGAPPGGPLRAIAVERVQGAREELYWGRVPEKVRRQAVEKAVRGGAAAQDTAPVEAGEHKRKRRRRG